MKLYVVKVEYEALVLAGSPEAAKCFANEIQRWDDQKVSAVVWAGSVPDGWDDDCFVYHRDGTNITVPEAIEIHKADTGAPT